MTNARDPDVESPVEPLYRLYNPEASIGGPVRKNRTFVYATVEQESESTQDGSELPDGSVLRQINAALASPGLARAATHQLAEPLFSTGSSSTLFFAKLDEQIDSANSVFVRYRIFPRQRTMYWAPTISPIDRRGAAARIRISLSRRVGPPRPVRR